MERDMKLIKRILKYVECNAKNDGRVLDVPEIPDYGTEQVEYHIDLCDQAGFLKVQRTADISYPVALTWQGHEMLNELKGN